MKENPTGDDDVFLSHHIVANVHDVLTLSHENVGLVRVGRIYIPILPSYQICSSLF